MTRARIPDAMFAHITDHGPLPVAELGACAKELGLTTARDPAKVVKTRLTQDERFFELPDGRWATLAFLLEGRWFTHRVRDDEVVAQAFADELDLGVPFLAVGQRGELWTGGFAWLNRGYLSGEGSWLEGVAAGDFVGVTFRDGKLAIAKVPEPPAPSIAGALVSTAIRDCLRAFPPYNEAGPAHAATQAVLTALAKDPALLTVPVRPLSELIPEAAERPTGRSYVARGQRCAIQIEEGCGCYRCRCKAIGHIRVELDGEQVRSADRRFRAAGRSLSERIADAVEAALSEPAPERLPARDALAAAPDDWDAEEAWL